MRISALLLSAVLLGSSLSLHAADDDDVRYGWFWGLSAGTSEFDFTGFTGNLPNPDIGYIRLAKMYEHFAFEGRIGGHTDVRSSGDSQVNSSYALYLEPRIPLGQRAGVYGLLGYGGVNFDTADFQSVSGNSGSYGAGIWVAPTKRFRVELEALRQYEKDAIRINSLTIGFTYDFAPFVYTNTPQ